MRTARPSVVVVANDVPRDTSSVMAVFSGAAREVMLVAGRSIPDKDLYVDPEEPRFGREESPHISVQCGISGDNPSDTAAALARLGPAKIKIGKVSAFRNDEKPYDVLIIEVDSEDLAKAHNAILKSVDADERFPDYKPHITVAYLKKGLADKYVDTPWSEAVEEVLSGAEVTFDSLVFSDRESRKTQLPISANKDNFRSDPNSTTNEGRAHPALHVGSVGFSKTAWAGSFYPTGMRSKDRLRHYAKSFNTVEISCPGGVPPDARTLLKWRESVPEGFPFAFSGLKVTAGRPTKAWAIKAFVNRVAILGSRLGPVSLCLQGYVTAPWLRSFFGYVPPGFKYSVELPNIPISGSIMRALADLDVAVVISSPEDINMARTTRWTHIRTQCADTAVACVALAMGCRKPVYAYSLGTADDIAKISYGLLWPPAVEKTRTERSPQPRSISPEVSAPSADETATGPENAAPDKNKRRKGPPEPPNPQNYLEQYPAQDW